MPAPRINNWSNPSNYFMHTQTCRALIAGLAKQRGFPLDGCKVLDVGCATGTWLLEFAQWHAPDLHGIDLDEARVDAARRRLPEATLHCGDARRLPWEDNTFDIVSQFTVFTSVLSDKARHEIAREMMRVLKPSGTIVWYDFCFNSPGNPNVRGIKPSEISQLFAGCDIQGQRVTLAPPISRPLVPLSWPAALLLEQFPFLCTHYLALISKPANAQRNGRSH
ncbi:MAG TPA: class I SAM-dependent methyltransferase [Bryobacteraceae bacterium]|nr:class I SAM-dependent methyltransferase [Bryobacteraceae bacterium]